LLDGGQPPGVRADRTDEGPLVGYLGGALILLTVVSGLALAVLARR